MCTGGRDSSGAVPGIQSQPLYEEQSEGDRLGEMVIGELIFISSSTDGV